MGDGSGCKQGTGLLSSKLLRDVKNCSPVQDWAVETFLLLGLLNDALSQELLDVRQVV